MGFSSDLWGPSAWYLLHFAAERHAEKSTDKGPRLVSMLLAMGKVLPCKFCRDNFELEAAKLGIKPALPKWKSAATVRLMFHQLHSSVNERLGKPAFPLERLGETYERKDVLRFDKNTAVFLHYTVVNSLVESVVPVESVVVFFERLTGVANTPLCRLLSEKLVESERNRRPTTAVQLWVFWSDLLTRYIASIPNHHHVG